MTTGTMTNATEESPQEVFVNTERDFSYGHWGGGTLIRRRNFVEVRRFPINTKDDNGENYEAHPFPTQNNSALVSSAKTHEDVALHSGLKQPTPHSDNLGKFLGLRSDLRKRGSLSVDVSQPLQSCRLDGIPLSA